MGILQSDEKKTEAVKDLLDQLVKNENWPMTLLIGDYLSRLEPQSFFAQRALGYASLELHDLDGAEKYLLKALELGDSDPDTLIQISRVYSYRGDLNNQIVWLERALAENPDKIVASFFLALAYRSRGEIDRAEEILKGIIGVMPDLVPPRRVLADLYLSAGNLDGAEEQLREAVALRDGISESLSKLGYVLKSKGKLNEALDIYFQALDSAPNNPVAYYNIGDTFLTMDDSSRAISYLRKASELDPDNSLYNYDLGLTYFNLRRYAECEAASRDALKFDSDMQLGRTNIGMNATTNLGLAYLNQGRLKDAENSFRRNIRLTASSYFNLGLALHWQGNYKEALSQFLHAVEINPDDAPFWDMVGNAWMELGDLERAREAFEKAIGLDHSLASAQYDLGVVFSRMNGKEMEAMEQFSKAIVLDEKFPLPYYTIACLYALAGKKEQALEYLNRAVELGFLDRRHADEDHDLDSLRETPEFRKIMEKMGLRKSRANPAPAETKSPALEKPDPEPKQGMESKKTLGSGNVNTSIEENWERYIW